MSSTAYDLLAAVSRLRTTSLLWLCAKISSWQIYKASVSFCLMVGAAFFAASVNLRFCGERWFFKTDIAKNAKFTTMSFYNEISAPDYQNIRA